MAFWRRRDRGRRGEDRLGGEPALRGPERAYYQRLSGDFSTVASNGRLALTPTRLVFISRIGRDVSVPLAQITEARDQKIERFHVGGHDRQLVIATESGEIGFLLDDSAGWAAAVQAQLPD